MPRFLLILEFILLCLVVPGIVVAYRLAPFMFVFLWAVAGYAWLMTRAATRGTDIWQWRAINAPNLRRIIPRWIVCCLGMTVIIYLYDPGRAWGIFDRLPIWGVPLLLLAYTFLSALPQEFVFCTFFFRRYANLFPTDRRRIMASAVVFAWAHVLFINPVAPPLSLIAGLIFADTYARTRSLALVTLEHALYGGWLFIVGLGWYFYGGAVGLN